MLKKIIFLLLLLGVILPAGAQEYDLDIEIDTDTLEMPPSEEGEAEGEEELDVFEGSGFSRREESFSLYGYLVNYSAGNLYPEGRDPRTDLGNVLYLRLKGDFAPEEFLQFHFEASYTGSTGNQNFFALMDSYGMLPPEHENAIYEDFVQSFSIDHLWGSASLGFLDLQFGKIPLAWGTGYVFNPTARTAASSFMDTVAEETPGTLSVTAGFQLPRLWSLQGYLAFQDKSHSTGVSLGDGDFDNLPLGLKVTGVAGSFDFSLGMAKEVFKEGSDYRRTYFAAADFAGAAGPFGVYGEAALALPGEDSLSFDFGGYDLLDQLEAALGFDYEFSGAEVTARCEFYHNGPGTADPELYDNTLVLGGARSVQGREYLFLHLERLFFDYLTLSLGGLTNLNDLSTILFPEIRYELASDFTVSTGAFLFLSDQDGEFGGDYGPLPVDLTTTALYFRMKLSF